MPFFVRKLDKMVHFSSSWEILNFDKFVFFHDKHFVLLNCKFSLLSFKPYVYCRRNFQDGSRSGSSNFVSSSHFNFECECSWREQAGISSCINTSSAGRI